MEPLPRLLSTRTGEAVLVEVAGGGGSYFCTRSGGPYFYALGKDRRTLTG